MVRRQNCTRSPRPPQPRLWRDDHAARKHERLWEQLDRMPPVDIEPPEPPEPRHPGRRVLVE